MNGGSESMNIWLRPMNNFASPQASPDVPKRNRPSFVANFNLKAQIICKKKDFNPFYFTIFALHWAKILADV